MRVPILMLSVVAIAACSKSPTAPPARDTGYEVTVVTATADAHTARIVWRVQPRVPGAIPLQRRLGDAPWKEFGSLIAADDGRVTLEDGTVQPGAEYSYRLRLPAGPVGEVAIEVPG